MYPRKGMVEHAHEASVQLPGQESSQDAPDQKKYVITC